MQISIDFMYMYIVHTVCVCVCGLLNTAYLVQVLSRHREGLGGLTMPGISLRSHMGAKRSGKPTCRDRCLVLELRL